MKRFAAQAIGRAWLAAAMVMAGVACAESHEVVINEIMYHPPGHLENLQYIELFNTGSDEVDLTGWSFSKGVKFVFGKETKLAAGGFLVVCRDHPAFVEHYGTDAPVAGSFEGHLSHSGERVELSDASKQVIDAVKFADAAPWPAAADGHSSSLERICPFSSGDDASNWAASNLPELKAPAGTPGRANDSFSANPLPVINGVTLAPASPRPEQDVTVQAMIADADGVQAVELSFQVASANSLSDSRALPMQRVAGDEHSGRYEAILPAQPEGRLVRYRIHATDATGSKRASPMPNDLRGAWSYSTFVNNNTARIPFGLILYPGGEPPRTPLRRFGSANPTPTPTRGADAFVYMPTGRKEVQTFDFVRIPRRQGGYKVHFLDDQTLRDMTSINIIFENQSRFALAEALSYEVYRLAGVPAEVNEHMRLSVGGEERGYHLLIEQPNKAFLARNQRDTTGNLYKLIWYGNGVIGKHEKKTNLTSDHSDLLAALEGLNNLSGAAQWAFIKEHFNVEEFTNYFAVNMCIQNWDGFHNNFFVYHDINGTGRWEIYPWDEDKTWGDYDGASRKYDWYSMPLTYGMTGSVRPAELGGAAAGDSFRAWWRAPGLFSGPLLANPQFRERFLVRLREVCTKIFTEEKIFPLIATMENRLEAEVPIRARAGNGATSQAVEEFRNHIQSFRNQVTQRRKFILGALGKPKR